MSNAYEDIVGQAEKDSGGGKYLPLKNKNDKVVIRIASEPVYINKHWMIGADGKNTAVNCTGEACVYCGKDTPPADKIKKSPLFAWVVLDRNDNAKPKIFKGPLQIAKSLKDLSTDPEWGDPTGYDVSITRTEEPGSGYYKVVPTKNSTPINDEEKEAIKNSNFDLKGELDGGVKSENIGSYSKEAEELETASPAKNDVKQEQLENDDIPF